MIEKIGFGSSTLTSIGNYRKIINLLNYTYELGIRHYDTAPLYGKGYSEIIIGKFLRNKREKVTLASKFGLGDNSNAHFYLLRPLLIANRLSKSLNKSNNPNLFGIDEIEIKIRKIDRADIEKSFLKTIKSLNTNYLDYYFLHEGLPSFLTDEALMYLESLKKNGDVIKLGIATSINSIINERIVNIEMWDVFQYEGNNAELKKIMMNKYPDKEHIHHSCLKSSTNNIIKSSDIPQLLLNAVKTNSNGKVLFSSRSLQRIKNNLNLLILEK